MILSHLLPSLGRPRELPARSAAAPPETESELPARVATAPPEGESEPLARVATAPPEGESEPLARVALEKVCGTVQAVGKVPTVIVPGLVAGAVNGASGGLDEKKLGRILDLAAGVQMAVLVAVARGRGRSKLKTAEGSVVKLGKMLLAPAGDHSKVARELAAHKPDGNVAERALKGAAHGVKTSVDNGLATSYSEGRGDAAGVWEGAEMVPVILQEGENPEGWLARLAGGATAVFLLPGAVADGLAIALDAKELSGPLLVVAGSTAAAATVGALALGAPAALVGGGVALAVSLTRAGATHELVQQCIEQFTSSAEDLGDPLANERRDFAGAVVVSGAAGARAGYQAWS